MRAALLMAAACVVCLSVVGSGAARPGTTNQPAIFTVKVTLTDTSMVLRPNHAARGSTVTFILTNRGRKTHTFVIGDVKRGPGYGQGFARTLRPNQQFTIVMYLDYRGVLKYFNRSGTTTTARGAFRVI
jgi:hypothetical protein